MQLLGWGHTFRSPGFSFVHLVFSLKGDVDFYNRLYFHFRIKDLRPGIDK